MRSGRTWPRRLLSAVATMAVVGVTLVPAAGAAVAPRDRVYPSYLPTVTQLSRIYPDLVGGSRAVGRYVGLGEQFSCWDWTGSFTAADGRWSSYTLEGGGMPYFKGMEDPASFVFKFHTRTAASDAYWQQQRFVLTCMGEQSADGTTARLWRQRVPAMGQGSIAYRTVQRLETVNGHRKTRELHIAVLDGRYLVNVYNQARRLQPDRSNGVRLMKITLGNIG
jgi:hypothetical protein